MDEVLKCIDVQKEYRHFSLQSVSMEVRRGYLTGMIGINGAGKSTLIHILAGIDSRFKGKVIVDGLDLRENYQKAKQKIALVSERISYFTDKTPLENGELLGLYFDNWSMEEFYIWLDKLNLPKGQPLYQFSKGMYMKYQIAFAMSYGAEFLLLDEPTAGFDPVFRKDFMKILQDIRDRQVGILMSTHIISDIEDIADYIVLIDHGEVKLNGTRETIGDKMVRSLIEERMSDRIYIGDLLKRKGGVR